MSRSTFGVSIFRVGEQGIDEELAYWDTMLMVGSREGAAAVDQPDPGRRGPPGDAARQLGARAQAELAVDAAQVALDRLLRQEQPRRDLPVREPSATMTATCSSRGDSSSDGEASRRGRPAPLAAISSRVRRAQGAAPSSSKVARARPSTVRPSARRRARRRRAP